jgi:hypothetical protein
MIQETQKAPRPAGPIKFPQTGYTRTTLALRGALRGHATSPSWIPQGLSPELDELRAKMLTLGDRVRADVDKLRSLRREFEAEDTAYQAKLEAAIRDGMEAPTDERTTEQDREEQLDAIHERIAAGVDILAEHADRIVAKIREQEDQLLSALRGQIVGAQDKRREAERLVAEAQALEWQLHRTGQWVLHTADDGPMGRQPAPAPAPMPASFNRELLKTSLTRPWARPRPAA